MSLGSTIASEVLFA